MTKKLQCYAAAVTLAVAILFGSIPAYAEDLFSKSCFELVRLAENYQTDLKTIETVLGSAIDAGNLDRIKNYKLRRSVIKQQLTSTMRAIEAKGCARK
jgi:hypothetical protein